MNAAADSTNDRRRGLGFVDDDEAFLKSIERFDAVLGARTLTTPDPQEAIAWVVAGRIATLVTDLRMPATSGLDLLSRVRKIDQDVEMILLTGYNLTDAERAKADELGIRVFDRVEELEQLIAYLSRGRGVISTAHAVAREIRLEALERAQAEFIQDLTAELRSIPEFATMPIAGSPDVATVGKMLDEIERLTPVGLDYLRSWRRAKATLRRRGRLL